MINSGTCFRAPDPVLGRWAADHGIAWAAELDADYAEAEEMLAVTPVDPERMGRNGQLLREAAEAMGVAHEPLRRNAGSCAQCSSCPQGCRLDAKRAMHVSYLPRAVAAGARVRAGVDVRRIAFARTGAPSLECAVWPQAGARASASHAQRSARAAPSFLPVGHSARPSSCSDPGSGPRAGTSAGTSGSILPAGWARGSTRRSAAGRA